MGAWVVPCGGAGAASTFAVCVWRPKGWGVGKGYISLGGVVFFEGAPRLARVPLGPCLPANDDVPCAPVFWLRSTCLCALCPPLCTFDGVPPPPPPSCLNFGTLSLRSSTGLAVHNPHPHPHFSSCSLRMRRTTLRRKARGLRARKRRPPRSPRLPRSRLQRWGAFLGVFTLRHPPSLLCKE
jgi:hypothetical protein